MAHAATRNLADEASIKRYLVQAAAALGGIGVNGGQGFAR